MITGIYKITCIINNKIYIGSSINIIKRFKNHINRLNRNNHINPHLQNAWNLYTQQNFVFEIIEICNEKNLLEREQYWLDTTKSYDRKIGFNNTLKSDRPLGYKHTEENKKIMSNLKKGKKLSYEHRQKISKSNKGRKHSDETKNKIRISKLGSKNPMYGKKENEEKKKKRMKNMLIKERWNKGLTKKDDERINKLCYWAGKTTVNAIKCKLINLVTGEILEADSLKKISKLSNLSISTINRIKNNTAGKKIMSNYRLEVINES